MNHKKITLIIAVLVLATTGYMAYNCYASRKKSDVRIQSSIGHNLKESFSKPPKGL